MVLAVAACSGATGSHSPVDDGGGFTPCLSSVMPASGFIGSEVTLRGDFGDTPVQVALLDEAAQLYPASVRQWSPSEVVIAVPAVGFASYQVHVAHGCALSPPAQFTVLAPPRVYLDNNVNNADGFDTITTLTYDPIAGALTPVGPPTSTGLPASGRPGCRGSLVAVGAESRLYASSDTGVTVFHIDTATGALSPIGTYASGSTGGGSLRWTLGAFVWQATDGGIVAWHVGAGNNGLFGRMAVTPTAAAAMTLFGDRPALIFTTRGDGSVDSWSASYVPQPEGTGVNVVATASAGSPFTVASNGAGVAYIVPRNSNPLLWVPTAAGLGLWQLDPQTLVPHELAGSPVALAAPSGSLTTPVFASSQVIYMASAGSSYLVGATLDAVDVPSPAAGSPWSFAPALTNLSCIATLPGLTAVAPRRLVAADAGNRRVGVFDLPPGGARPVPVAGSPFALTETPAELASGIAVLSPL